MTSGTECSKCGSTDGIGFMGDVPMCMDCYGVPQATPPPLQPGDAVWVRAVVVRTLAHQWIHRHCRANAFKAMVQAIVAGKSIRRIEGEVK